MSQRPLRTALEGVTDRFPKGPLGFLGRGNAVGAINYFTVATVNGILPIEGTRVGYSVESHNVERSGMEETHTYIINSYNRDVARFLAEYRSAPSNLNFLSSEIEVTEAEPIRERKAATTWRVEAVVTPRE